MKMKFEKYRKIDARINFGRKSLKYTYENLFKTKLQLTIFDTRIRVLPRIGISINGYS